MGTLERRAERAEGGGDLALALRLWRELALAQREPVFFARYGRVAQRLERWEEAEAAFAQALQLDPNFALGMVCMGDLWARRSDKTEPESFEVAKDWFLKALRRERNARTLTLLGAAYRALGDSDAARDAFAEAVRIDPSYEEALYNLAIAEEEDCQKSLSLLKKALDIDPQYFDAHQALGKLYQKTGNLPKAEYHFRWSLEIEPDEFWSLLYLANALAVQGKLREAEQNYRTATTLYPERKEGAEFYERFLQSIGKEQRRSLGEDK